MKILILIILLNTFGFSMTDEQYNKFLKENKEHHEMLKKIYREFSCTPFQETGILWGINKIIGGTPITISIQKTEMSSIIIDQSKINKISKDRFEDSNKRIYLKSYTFLHSLDDPYNFNINTILIDTKNKTTWYNCIFIKEKIPQ